VKEAVLISHDTTWFGRDRGVKHGLALLLDRLARIEDIAWIRFLYGYPEEVDAALLEAMSHPKVCRYLDIPFQHADAGLIRAMRRGLDGGRALRLLDRIRTKLPGVAVRTSLIVGFPGEGREEFAALRRFVAEARFDHLGVFAFSPEEGTAAGRLTDDVPPEEKEARRSAIMELQAGISREKNAGRVGRTIEVLVEGPDPGSGGRWTGRGRFQAPDVDGVVRFTLPPGMAEPPAAIVRVEIDAASDYDLAGRLAA
jgi:ribosomal protein S12 methylthiotransferase